MEPPPPASSMEPSLDDPSAWEWSHLLEFPLDEALLDDRPFLLQETAAPPPLSHGRVRKRDPRLICDNFLAGRIPCACPELDEAAEDEEEMVVGMAAKKRARGGGRGTAAVMRCQVLGCEVDITELKGYHRRHKVCLRCANAGSVVLEGDAQRYCQQCGKFHRLEDFDEGKRSCRRKLERHNKRRRRRPSDNKSFLEKEREQEEPVHLDSAQEEPKREYGNGVSFDSDSLRMDDKATDGDALLDSEGRGSPFCTDPSIRTGCSNNAVPCAVSSDTQIEERTENPKSVISSSYYENKSMYSTACPTGRISFKLYDWNPAEFPRRLRLQIFQWLASMPVELEGYIRPGCTILTIFIAMPHLMWKKLSNDPARYLHHFFKEPQNLFFGRGNIHINLNNTLFQYLRDGTSLVNAKMEVHVPKLHYVHPVIFEAGKPVEFFVCGSNLFQPKFRFLLSFAGKYLGGETCHAISHGNMSTCHNIGAECFQESEHQIFKLNFPHSEAKLFGPAFLEVENESGLSNFIPVLFADKHICLELQSMQHYCSFDPSATGLEDAGGISSLCEVHVSQHSLTLELLLDIAWLLREPKVEENTAFFNSINVQRVTNILSYLMQRNSVNILHRVLRHLDCQLECYKSQEVLKVTGEICSGDVKLFEKCMSDAKKKLQKKNEFYGTDDLSLEIPDYNCVSHTDNEHHQPNNLDHVQEEVAVGTLGKQHVFSSSRGRDDSQPLLADYLQRSDSRHIQVKLPAGSWDFSRKVITPRLLVLVMASVLVCCGLCAALLHPQMASRFITTARRCVSRAVPEP